jgi:hypothetical protein
MGDHQPATRQPWPLRTEGSVVEVKLDPLLVEVGFADEQIRAARGLYQRLGPLGVA